MLVTGKHNERFVVAEVNKAEYEASIQHGFHVSSLPRQHTLWFEEGEPHVAIIKEARVATEQEIAKYSRSKFHFLNSNSSNIIWDANGLMLGNYVKRSSNEYWSASVKNTICQITIDEMILIDTQAPRGIFEYIDLDDEWLDQFGFIIGRTKAIFKFNELGNILQLDKKPMLARLITNGAPVISYEFATWPRAVRYVHTLQNITALLTGRELVRKDGKQ